MHIEIFLNAYQKFSRRKIVQLDESQTNTQPSIIKSLTHTQLDLSEFYIRSLNVMITGFEGPRKASAPLGISKWELTLK